MRYTKEYIDMIYALRAYNRNISVVVHYYCERFPNPDKRVIARATNVFNETESWIESCGHGRCNSNNTEENIFMKELCNSGITSICLIFCQ